MTGRLAGKVAIITGAASGMGRAEALLFAAEGATVVVADIEDAAGEALAASHGNLHYRHLDVAEHRQWHEVVEQTAKTFGKIDILLNNAAILRVSRLEDTTPERYEKVVRINQFGTFYGMRAVIPLMKAARSGSIINVSSAAGLGGLPGMTAYVASKYAVRGMTKVAALELGEFNVRVNSIHPGIIDTPMTQGAPDDDVWRTGAGTPFRRAGRPQEVAELALFLASDAASFCSGAEYTCDGALTATPRF